MMQFIRKKLFFCIYLIGIFLVYFLLYRSLNVKNEASSFEGQFHATRGISNTVNASELALLQKTFKKLFRSYLGLHPSKYAEFNLKETRMLIVLESVSEPSFNARELATTLQGLNANHNLIALSTFLKVLINQLRFVNRKYCAFAFESYRLFASLGSSRRELLDLCSHYNIGIVFLSFETGKSITPVVIGNSSISVTWIHNITFCELNQLEGFYKMTKFNARENVMHRSLSLSNSPPGVSFNVGGSNTYEPILNCSSKVFPVVRTSGSAQPRQVLVGIELTHLMTNILVDVLNYASHGELFAADNMIRYVQVDIDDIFVGSNHKRMKQSDVTSLIDFQEAFLNKRFFTHSIVFRFKFNLGYSGYYFKTSVNEEENLADELLLDNKHMFNWFDHSWSHLQPHTLNASTLKEQIYLNYNFALRHGIPVDSFYAVSPHHSGIYPAYDELYQLLSDILLIKATSTELYPHGRPVHTRRGFTHKNIMVLPRQPCGVFTHTNFFADYPNSRHTLIEQTNGGDIFKSVLFNRIVVFMTHMTNYANDRVAIFALKELFVYLDKWTNLKFHSLPPVDLARKYFELYPEFREPVWTNFCLDNKHLAIWHVKNATFCSRVPKLIIVGPQKTGTTALYSYLNAHPSFESNKLTAETFEEPQFFTDKFYMRGPDWYLSLFEKKPFNISIEPTQSPPVIVFEKSANYFTEPKAPARIKSFMSDVRLAFIIINPVDRAYSWYQHMRAHNDTVALNFKFIEILRLNTTNTTVLPHMRKLRDHCLDPGLYAKHLRKWLFEFPAWQMIVLDGEELKIQPNVTMIKVQHFMQVQNVIDYTSMLAYSEKKKNFCLINYESRLNKSPMKCLGASKGRPYSKLDHKSRGFLKKYYDKPNHELFKLLKRKKFDVPQWLTKSVK